MIEMIEFKTGHFQERFGVVYPAPFFERGTAMANQLSMAQREMILTLIGQGWSQRRISRELGVHRDTIAGYIAQAKQDLPPVQPLDGSAEDSKQAISITGSTAIVASIGKPHRISKPRRQPILMPFRPPAIFSRPSLPNAATRSGLRMVGKGIGVRAGTRRDRRAADVSLLA